MKKKLTRLRQILRRLFAEQSDTRVSLLSCAVVLRKEMGKPYIHRTVPCDMFHTSETTQNVLLYAKSINPSF